MQQVARDEQLADLRKRGGGAQTFPGRPGHAQRATHLISKRGNLLRMPGQIGIHAFNGPYQRQNDIGLLPLPAVTVTPELGDILKNGHHTGFGLRHGALFLKVRRKKADSEQALGRLSFVYAHLDGVGLAGVQHFAHGVHQRSSRPYVKKAEQGAPCGIGHTACTGVRAACILLLVRGHPGEHAIGYLYHAVGIEHGQPHFQRGIHAVQKALLLINDRIQLLEMPGQSFVSAADQNPP